MYDNSELIMKMNREIAAWAAKPFTPKQGLVYELRPVAPGYYTNYHGAPVYLTPNDVWKYGETTKGEDRCNQGFYNRENVKMNPIYYGNQIEIKIYEKRMIYGYVLRYGHLPPGNRIFR